MAIPRHLLRKSVVCSLHYTSSLQSAVFILNLLQFVDTFFFHFQVSGIGPLELKVFPVVHERASKGDTHAAPILVPATWPC